MLPQIFTDDLQTDFETVIPPSKTFALRKDGTRIYGTIDELEALQQTIYLLLSVERYEYPIYPWSVFFETQDLFGKDVDYVASEIPRRITECLLQDDRITGTSNFVITNQKGSVSVTYTCHTIFGDINLEREVSFNG